MVTHIGQRFNNKVVLVTGAAHGIGRAIVHRFGSEGGQVIVNDINAQDTEDTVQEIITNGGLAMPGIADVSDKSQVDRLFDTVLEHFGTVDVLVNNAGLINVERHFLEADEVWWDRVLAANLKSVFLGSFRAAQVMACRHRGVIINMSSGGATRAHRGMAAYDASKGVLRNIQGRAYGGRHIGVDLHGLNFEKLCEAYGIHYYSVTRVEAFRSAIETALAKSRLSLVERDMAAVGSFSVPFAGYALNN